MGMKDRLMEWSIGAYRRLPVSQERKAALRDLAFRRLGFLFGGHPSLLAWEDRKEFEAENDAAPDERRRMRKEAFDAWFDTQPPPPTFLFVTHGMGGGTETHVRALAEALEREGVRVLVLRGNHVNRHRACLSFAKEEAGKRLPFDLADEEDALLETLSRLNIRHLHVHHTVDLPGAALAQIRRMAGALEVKYDFTVHDYFAICPRFTLFDEAVRGYCGEPVAVSKCTSCVKAHGSPAGREVDVGRWRERYGEFLHGARKIFVPSEDAARRLKRYYGDLEFTVRPHGEAPGVPARLMRPRKEGEPLKVLTIGAIAPHKGSDVLLRCAQDALKRKLPLHFTVAGHTDIDYRLKRLPNVTVTGRYEGERALETILREGEFHLVFLPAVWPETYNYTLSEALRQGFFPVVFDIGAPAERLRKMGYGQILPLEDYMKPEAVNGALLACVPRPVPEAALQQSFARQESYLKDYYGFGERLPAHSRESGNLALRPPPARG